MTTWEQVQEGVYQCQRGTDLIRIVVARQLPEVEHNAMLHLLSASAQQVAYGASHYRQRSDETSTLLQTLFEGYQREGLTMPYTMEDFRRDYVKKPTPQEQLEALLRLSPEERGEALRGLSLEERLKVLDDLSAEEIEQYLARRRKDSSSPE